MDNNQPISPMRPVSADDVRERRILRSPASILVNLAIMVASVAYSRVAFDVLHLSLVVALGIAAILLAPFIVIRSLRRRAR